MRKIACHLFWLFALMTITGCGVDADTPLILFVGNSYTSQNNLPRHFARLSDAGGHDIRVETFAPGGWTLQDQAASAELRDKLTQQPWLYVVLQEQSVVPALEPYRTHEMYPAARTLHSQIEEAGSQTLFYMTWGRQDGMAPADTGFTTFAGMQAQLETGYLGIANELDAPVAPVGVAWKNTLAERPDLSLWAADGSHPTELGTYLAACVFYATIYRESPEGLTYHAGLSDEDAQFLQQIAAETVLADPAQWNLK
jgi:hypothetical protein